MVGCNCSSPIAADASFGEGCCTIKLQGNKCTVPVPKDYYCGFCEGPATYIACQVWLDLCAAMRIATTLSTTRFKTQVGRDSVFGVLKFENASQFSKHDRFGNNNYVNLNTPIIFDCLCSIASAASYRDRLGEKTRFAAKRHVTVGGKDKEPVDHSNWGFSDASTSYHKNVVLLRSLLRRYTMSRQSFERAYSLTWMPAGSAVIFTGETPVLGQLNASLACSPFGLFTDGAFAVVEEKPKDTIKFDDKMIMYPVQPWDTPLPCDGHVLIFRPNGKTDFVPYHYECRKFTFKPIDGSIQGDKKTLEDFIESAEQFYEKEHGTKLECPHWFTYFKKSGNTQGGSGQQGGGGGGQQGGGGGGQQGGGGGGQQGGGGGGQQGGGGGGQQGGGGGGQQGGGGGGQQGGGGGGQQGGGGGGQQGGGGQTPP